jgi:ribosomal protein S18 acetylase RimI-like enzyme
MNNQRQGIGRQLIEKIISYYPEHALTLEANADSEKSIKFYEGIGMKIKKLVTIEEDDETCEFALFETPLDKKGKKI